MSKITSFVNDVDLNEVASLVNQLSSYKDDSGFGIFSIRIDSVSDVHLHPDLFFNKFSTFSVRKLAVGDYDHPYVLSTKIDGVDFNSTLSEVELADLKIKTPELWEHIQCALKAPKGGVKHEG